ncbi:reverse transcriptase [Gossypium australe]|uniref:Reverse transcriptase n=1 Tax=Gossypium australe TaxID=47621 RepID=A0A5B6WFU9_9ROSI|nr:reverse transcriptase [Gossypium australe]
MSLQNIRRLGKPRVVHNLRNKLREVRPQILFLMETKISARRMEGVRRKCGFHHGIDVGAKGSKSRLSLGWRQDDVGGRTRVEKNMKAFHYALLDCDLGFIGRWFTWKRGRFVATNTQERLDRRLQTRRCGVSFQSFLLLI